VIVMENHDWVTIRKSSSARYINEKLVPMASYTDNFRSPDGLHPSLPNYIWMEAGDSLGITDDALPEANHRATPDHLVSQLSRAGLDWRSYQQGISGEHCPLTSTPLVDPYYPRHNPMIYFDDVTDGNDRDSANCIRHVRPYEELTRDLAANKVAPYNFITPDVCHDMHGGALPCLMFHDRIAAGDHFLEEVVPPIMASQAYKDGGAIFITWDESEEADDTIGMIVLSPLAKGHGFHDALPYTHSSMLRTVERIFGVPYLRGAQTSNDLSNLFVAFP
jgi:hypothetical protein